MADLSLLNEMIGARVPIISIETPEEERAIRLIQAMTHEHSPYPFQRGKKIFLWDIVSGLAEIQAGGDLKTVGDLRDPLELIEYIAAYQPAGVRAGQRWGAFFLLRDLHPFMDAALIRSLRNMAHRIKPTSKSVLLLSTGFDIPVELQPETDIYQFPLPDKTERVGLVRVSREQAPRTITVDVDTEVEDLIADALAGMTEDAGRGAIGRSMVRQRQFSRHCIPDILEQKALHIRASGLEFIKEKIRLDDIGGLERLRAHIQVERAIFEPGALEFGAEPPKGMLAFGPPGTGKSYMAKAIAGEARPLFRFDLGAMLNSLYGESERNVTMALRLAEEVGACLWVDEFHHAFAQGRQEDGGTTKRIIAKLLNWMQEQTACYVIATANDISGVDPAFLRAGRFDSLWYVDLPGPRARAEILRIHLAKRQRDPAQVDLSQVAALSRGFGGAELEEAIKRAIRRAWVEGARAITTEDLIAEIQAMTPLSVTMREQIEAMRRWAHGRAMRASDEQEEDLDGIPSQAQAYSGESSLAALEL
jgi:AAA+ superfamily predicted ATPase